MLSNLIISSSIVVISLLFGCALLVVWWHYKLPRHVALWAGSFTAAALGHGLRTGGALLPSQNVLFAMLACHASVGGFTLLAWGFRLREQKPARGVLAGWAVATVILIWAWVDHGMAWRAVSRFVTAAGDAYMVAWVVATLWHKRGPGAVARWAMGLFGVYIVGVAVAAGLARPGGVISNEAFIAVLSIGTPTGMIGTGVMTLLIVVADIMKGLRTQANSDALTGLLNRRGIDEAVSLLRSGGQPVVVVIADLDHFKDVNDRLGHAGGDEVLCRFAHHLRASMQPGEVVARTGGEEFVMLLPGCDVHGALARMELLRISVPTAFAHDERLDRVTSSFGLATLQAGESLDAALARADAALYCSKREGRDRVTMA